MFAKPSSRKAVVEIQFNWLFIMIVGAIILIFFITIAGKYKGGAERELASDILDKLAAISTSGQMSSDTNTLIDISDIDLSTDCDPELCNELGCFTEFDFSDQGISAPRWMDIEPVFSQRRIKSDYLISWSLDWNMPYKISSLLYLTSPGYRYVLVYKKGGHESDSFAQDLLLKLKENKHLNVEKVAVKETSQAVPGRIELEHKGEAFTKFIFLFLPGDDEDFTVSNSIIRTKKFDVIYIQPSGDAMNEGTVYYSKIENNRIVADRERNSVYLGLPMLIGAIYSDDYEFYKCNIHKLLLKYTDLNEVYMKKTASLYDYYSSHTDSRCSYFYGLSTQQSLENIKSSVVDYDTYITNIPTIKNAVSELEQVNSMALTKDCPRIY